jgi:hypothetical protein
MRSSFFSNGKAINKKRFLGSGAAKSVSKSSEACSQMFFINYKEEQGKRTGIELHLWHHALDPILKPLHFRSGCCKR